MTTSVVGSCMQNLTQNGEPQRYSWGTQKKKLSAVKHTQMSAHAWCLSLPKKSCSLWLLREACIQLNIEEVGERGRELQHIIVTICMACFLLSVQPCIRKSAVNSRKEEGEGVWQSVLCDGFVVRSDKYVDIRSWGQNCLTLIDEWVSTFLLQPDKALRVLGYLEKGVSNGKGGGQGSGTPERGEQGATGGGDGNDILRTKISLVMNLTAVS